tara:strand:- start:26322 stop:26909 length:588 start_codon:yes stop_codon:yes gene_type:complete
MSATELTPDPVEKLPESPLQLIVEATTVPESIAVVHDEEIATTVEAAKSLEVTGAETATRADEYFSAETTSISAADQSYAGAATAGSEEIYNAHTGQAETFVAQADSYNVMGHSTAAISEESTAKSSALQRVAVVQIAAQEIAQRTELSYKQEADRTVEGVKQEMKALSAVDDAGAAQNLEGELKAAAEITAPKV